MCRLANQNHVTVLMCPIFQRSMLPHIHTFGRLGNIAEFLDPNPRPHSAFQFPIAGTAFSA